MYSTSIKACFKLPNTAGAEISPKERIRSVNTPLRMQLQLSAILVGEIRISGWVTTSPQASLTAIMP